jgi:hypothetical protein
MRTASTTLSDGAASAPVAGTNADMKASQGAAAPRFIRATSPAAHPVTAFSGASDRAVPLRELRRDVRSGADDASPRWLQLSQDTDARVVGEMQVRQVDNQGAAMTLAGLDEDLRLAGRKSTIHLDRHD